MNLAFGTGRYYSPCAGVAGLLKALQLNFFGTAGTVHPAGSSAADTILPGAGHFFEFNSGDSFQNLAGRIVNACQPSQTTGIMKGNDFFTGSFKLNHTLAEFVCQKIEDMDRFKIEFAKILGIKILKRVISFRATKNYLFGARGADQIQIQSSKLLELLLVSIPECIVATTSFIIADHRFHPAGVDDLQHVLSTRDRSCIDIPENNVKIGSASYEIKNFSCLSCFPIFDPVHAILLNILGLDGHNGLKHSIVGRNTVESHGMGFITNKADEFRKIDVRRAADAALCAGQAVPNGMVREFLQSIKRALYNLPG